MGGLGALVIVVIFIVSRLCYKQPGESGDKTPVHSGNLVGMWLLIFLLWLIVNEHSSIASYIILLPFSIFIFPSIFSKICTLFGKVKLSYFLGGISYFYFRRSVYSGALLRGLQAVYHLKSIESKKEALRWLKGRALMQKSKIYSGEMILITIIDVLLLKPNDPIYMSKQLKLLDGIAKKSIPGSVSVFASKLALAPALSNHNWDEMRALNLQWDTFASNKIVKYLNLIDQKYIVKTQKSYRISFIYRKIFIGHCHHLKNLPFIFKQSLKVKSSPILSKRKLVKVTHSTLFSAGTLCEQDLVKYRKTLINQEQEMHWKNRAKQLGSWELDKSWNTITQSIEQCLISKVHSQQNINQISHDELDRLHKNLHYICQSIERRLDTKDKSSGIQNYLDWMKIRQHLELLKVDELALASAFSENHAVIWNWVAELWNNKKERCLVHYISTICAPLAKEYGPHELYETLYGITMGKYK